MSSTEDKARGGVNEATGEAKQVAGNLTGNEEMKAEGKGQEAKGEAQQALGDAKEAAGDALHKAGQAIKH